MNWFKLSKYSNRPIKKLQHLVVLVIFFATSLNINFASAHEKKLLLRIAVASNFTPVLKELLGQFESASNINTQLITGSTGALYLQLKHGAPFDIFLAGDVNRAQQLERDNLIVKDSRVTYATGQLALFSKSVTLTIDDLKTPSGRFAIANPDTAPYGKAAQQALIHLGVWPLYKNNLVTGINVNQTFTQLRSQAVERGIIAYSLLVFHQLEGTLIPANYYEPIEQQLVIMKNSQNIEAARELSKFLLSNEVQKHLSTKGYLSQSSLNQSGSSNLGLSKVNKTKNNKEGNNG
ncbi:MAG: molybdate ABC transporter substrate-binding protein [Colwellia sp.]